jgi:hypothetical protein
MDAYPAQAGTGEQLDSVAAVPDVPRKTFLPERGSGRGDWKKNMPRDQEMKKRIKKCSAKVDSSGKEQRFKAVRVGLEDGTRRC